MIVYDTRSCEMVDKMAVTPLTMASKQHQPSLSRRRYLDRIFSLYSGSKDYYRKLLACIGLGTWKEKRWLPSAAVRSNFKFTVEEVHVR